MADSTGLFSGVGDHQNSVDSPCRLVPLPKVGVLPSIEIMGMIEWCKAGCDVRRSVILAVVCFWTRQPIKCWESAQSLVQKMTDSTGLFSGVGDSVDSPCRLVPLPKVGVLPSIEIIGMIDWCKAACDVRKFVILAVVCFWTRQPIKCWESAQNPVQKMTDSTGLFSGSGTVRLLSV